MKNKILFSFFSFILLISLVSAQFFDFYYLRPSMILENEWLVFILIFLAIFSLVYMSLGNAFKTSQGNVDPAKKGAIVVISLVVGIIAASSIVQQAFWYGYFGDYVMGILYIGLAIAGIVGLVPVYKKMSKIFEPLTAVLLLAFILRLIIVYFLNPEGYTLFGNFIWENNLWQYYNFYNFVASAPVFWVLLFLMVLAFFWPVIKSMKGKSSGSAPAMPAGAQ